MSKLDSSLVSLSALAPRSRRGSLQELGWRNFDRGGGFVQCPSFYPAFAGLFLLPPRITTRIATWYHDQLISFLFSTNSDMPFRLSQAFEQGCSIYFSLFCFWMDRLRFSLRKKESHLLISRTLTFKTVLCAYGAAALLSNASSGV